MTDTQLQAVVSRNIRVLMAVRGVETQKDLAAQLGWIETKLTKSLRGDRKWSLEDLTILANVFGIAPAELIGDVTNLVNIAGPTRTGTDAVTRGVTGRYPISNSARIIPFPQAARLRAGYRIKRGGRKRLVDVTRAGLRGDRLNAAPVA